jgi:hypothetical protein
MRKRYSLALFFWLCFGANGFPDSIAIRDGRHLSRFVQTSTERELKLVTPGRAETIPIATIESVSFDGERSAPASTAGPASRRVRQSPFVLSTLRRRRPVSNMRRVWMSL